MVTASCGRVWNQRQRRCSNRNRVGGGAAVLSVVGGASIVAVAAVRRGIEENERRAPAVVISAPALVAVVDVAVVAVVDVAVIAAVAVPIAVAVAVAVVVAAVVAVVVLAVVSAPLAAVIPADAGSDAVAPDRWSPIDWLSRVCRSCAVVRCRHFLRSSAWAGFSFSNSDCARASTSQC